MTRQNVTDGPREVMTRKCPTCHGDGIVVSDTTTAVEIERKLRSLVTPGSRAKAFKVEVNAHIAELVIGPGAARLRELEEATKRRFFLVGREGVELDHFVVLQQGTLEKVAPDGPVTVGQELELKLGEVGLHDRHAGVANLDGIDVSVGDAATLVGKKVKARITAVTDDVAYAELIGAAAPPDAPITAEAEAEKPTRARRTTKKTDEPPAEAEAATDGETPEPEAATKKTRRGTRGGRGRKKKTDAAVTVSSEEQPAVDLEEPPLPVIHVPEPDLGREEVVSSENGDEPAPPKKKTRRGTRGGRNRRKKAGAAAPPATIEADEPAAAEDPAPAEQASNGGDEWSYTPMSEWGLEDEES
jgi:ribonuclease G